MRRILNGILIVSFVLSLTAAPAYAAPRRDDGDRWSPIVKIEKLIKRIIKKIPLEDISFPKP
jgi:hypothetical protein